VTPRWPALLAGLLTVLVLAGCSSEFGSGGNEGGVATSPDAARAKLSLLSQDPCNTDPDPRSTWPRCGRWVEEAASTARTAATALPGNEAITRAATGVQSGRDAFAARGCTSTGPTPAPDPGACIGALLATRTAVAGLDTALRAVP
jgi:hypothetical protein